MKDILTTNINFCWGGLFIEELARLGVTYLCLAPGSRCAPLTVAASENPRVETAVHYDERGLAYHALGYATATRGPAALICTSGTAGANFFPAIIEASKKKLPLIVITADRPPELRQTGAMQTIHQPGLFGSYVKWQIDMPCPDIAIDPAMVLTTVDQAVHMATHGVPGPVHINCMFREPLSPVDADWDPQAYLEPLAAWRKGSVPFTRYETLRGSAFIDGEALAAELNAVKNGVIAVGKLSSEEDRKAALLLARHLQWPILADGVSGLRTGVGDESIIPYFDQILLSENWQKDMPLDGVLHLGGRMTSKRYYDLIALKRPTTYMTVLNHPLRSDPLHRVSVRVQARVSDFCQAVEPYLKHRDNPFFVKVWRKANTKVTALIEKRFEKMALTEPSVARLISQNIPEGHGLFLSNSMPVRAFDMYADPSGPAVPVNGNRGASGIEGLAASASGYACGLRKPVTLFVGDLALLHDLNSLKMLKEAEYPVTVVVFNNDGGGIFSFLPIAEQTASFERFFTTPHGLGFKDAAKMFGLTYQRPDTPEAFLRAYLKASKASTSTLIEVNVDRDSNIKVYRDLQAEVREALG